jgi:cell division control protein 6
MTKSPGGSEHGAGSSPYRADGGTNDPLFSNPSPIFDRRELLRVGYVPTEDRIIGRDDEISILGTTLNEVPEGGVPTDNLLIYGKTGSGKSLVARHVTGRAVKASSEGVTVLSAYVNCAKDNTETRAIRAIAKQAKQSLIEQTGEDLGPSIPDSGIGRSQYLDRLLAVLDHADAFVVIIDEIDMLSDKHSNGSDEEESDDEAVLNNLSRAKENEETDCHIGIIAISNKVRYHDNLDERVKSSLQPEEIVFPPYDAQQLGEILERRRDAFHDGVLTQEALRLCAAHAAQEHGDARRAIEILHSAGKLADKRNDEQVTKQHVEAAREYADASRLRELVSHSTPHASVVLQALANLTERNDDQQSFKTRVIYEMYKRVCAKRDLEPLGSHRVRELLAEHAFHGITENHRTGGGKNEGSFLLHSLTTDTDLVFEALSDDDPIDTPTTSSAATRQASFDPDGEF